MTAQEALSYLKTQATTNCASAGQQQAVQALLADPKFLEAPAAQQKHHAYSGGLVIHTAEVLRCSLATIAAYPAADVAVLTCAAIFHDCEKVRDCEKNLVLVADGTGGPAVVVKDDQHPGGWRYTDYASKIRHVAGSFSKWNAVAARFGLDQGFIDKVGHCILAHHGRLEWGSPVEPRTVEALILHQSDMLSANYGEGREIPK